MWATAGAEAGAGAETYPTKEILRVVQEQTRRHAIAVSYSGEYKIMDLKKNFISKRLQSNLGDVMPFGSSGWMSGTNKISYIRLYFISLEMQFGRLGKDDDDNTLLHTHTHTDTRRNRQSFPRNNCWYKIRRWQRHEHAKDSNGHLMMLNWEFMAVFRKNYVEMFNKICMEENSINFCLNYNHCILFYNAIWTTNVPMIFCTPFHNGDHYRIENWN